MITVARLVDGGFLFRSQFIGKSSMYVVGDMWNVKAKWDEKLLVTGNHLHTLYMYV